MQEVEQLKTELSSAERERGSLVEKLRALNFCIGVMKKEVSLRTLN